jgi:hypothetical protein
VAAVITPSAAAATSSARITLLFIPSDGDLAVRIRWNVACPRYACCGFGRFQKSDLDHARTKKKRVKPIFESSMNRPAKLLRDLAGVLR